MAQGSILCPQFFIANMNDLERGAVQLFKFPNRTKVDGRACCDEDRSSEWQQHLANGA